MNYDLKEKIRDYWSHRAPTFDASFSHSILEGVELDAWKERYSSLVGKQPLNALELGSGTGEVSKVLLKLGHSVTGVDFSEPMQELSKIKHSEHPQIRYILGDAEKTQLDDAMFDLVTCRHLVWTLLDPEAALRDWFRVTKSGGHLVIFDGNFVAARTQDHLAQILLTGIEKLSPTSDQQSEELKEIHSEIKSQFYFADGLSFNRLADLVDNAGYISISRHSYEPIRRAQRKISPPYKYPRNWLRSFIGDRFILHAQKK